MTPGLRHVTVSQTVLLSSWLCRRLPRSHTPIGYPHPQAPCVTPTGSSLTSALTPARHTLCVLWLFRQAPRREGRLCCENPMPGRNFSLGFSQVPQAWPQRGTRVDIRYCYGLNVCVTPQIHMFKPNPQCDGIKKHGLWEVFNKYWLHEWVEHRVLVLMDQN